jgi:hypothetical protein
MGSMVKRHRGAETQRFYYCVLGAGCWVLGARCWVPAYAKASADRAGYRVPGAGCWVPGAGNYVYLIKP